MTWSALEPSFPEEMHPMQPEHAREVLDRALALATPNGDTRPPESAYHDHHVTAWRTLDAAAYEALAQDRAALGTTGDRYARFTRLAQALGRDPRAVLVTFCLDALLQVVHGQPPGATGEARVQAEAAYIAALNAVRLLYGWDMLGHEEGGP